MRVKLSNGDIVEINGEVVEDEPTTDPTTDPATDPTTDPTTDPATEPTTDPTTEPTTEPTTAEILATIKKLETKVDGEIEKIKNDFIAKITANPSEKKIDEIEKITVDDLADLY